MHKDVPAPPVLQHSPRVPLPVVRVLQEVKDSEVMAPRNLSNNLLDKLTHLATPPQTPAYKADSSGESPFMSGNSLCRSASEAVNDFSSPTGLISGVPECPGRCPNTARQVPG